MKKAILVLIVIIAMISLCACSQQQQAIENMTLGEGNGYATIVWNDRTYVPYGALSAYGERGKQIGIVDGNTDDKVYECKGYSTDKWIVEALPNDPPMLWKEINVTDIPAGWQSEYEWNNASAEQEAGSGEQVANSEEKPSDSEEMAGEAKDGYKEILLGKEDFINIDIADQHRKINLENIKEVVSDDEEIQARATKFAMVDLDGDGEKEIVLWIQVNQNPDYGFEILYLCNNKVYGFTLVYRQFMELKTDGTFYGSGGAADTRVCRLQLSENGYVIEDVSDTGKPQEEKNNVEWHDLTEDNISRITGDKK